MSNSRTPPSYAARTAAIDTSSSTSPQPAGTPANYQGPPSAHVPAPRAGTSHWPTVRMVSVAGPDSAGLVIATPSKSIANRQISPEALHRFLTLCTGCKLGTATGIYVYVGFQTESSEPQTCPFHGYSDIASRARRPQ